jgi:hypothetical protein
MSSPNFFGTFWRHLARRDASPESLMAAQHVDTTHLEQLVYDTIATFEHGCIQDDVLAALPQLPYSSVTARFRALLDKGYIEDTGHRRPGKSGRQQRVLKIKEPDHA